MKIKLFLAYCVIVLLVLLLIHYFLSDFYGYVKYMFSMVLVSVIIYLVFVLKK